MRALQALQRRVALMAARAVLRAMNDAGKTQRLQVELLAGELMDGVERFQDYGLTSVPHAGAEPVVLSLGGDRAHAVAIVVHDKRYRLTGLADGEVALYDDQGQKVHLTRAGIVIDGGGLPVTIQNTSLVTVDGDLAVTGTLDVTGAADFAGQVRHNGTRIDSTHRHSGVQSGGSNTGTVT